MEYIYLCIILSLFTVLNAVERKTVEELTNTCLNGVYHKSKPGPEAELFKYCAPWKYKSCCTEEVTKQLHISDAWYSLSWDHCGALSFNCRRHFLQDLCFYECSPNAGPWIQPLNTTSSIRNERIMHAPLCETDCKNWWNDCKDDLTCTDNWEKSFNWTTGRNTCPTGSTCRKFSDVFSNSNNFCEVIFDCSWKVVPDTEKCMHLWFDRKNGNPNDAVALARAEEIVNSCNALYSLPILILSTTSALLIAYLFF